MNSLATDPFLSMWSLFSGGPIARASVFALGVTPYLTAALVMQMLEGVIPSLKRLRDEGLDGQRRKASLTRTVSLVIALIQAPLAALSLSREPLSVLPRGWYVALASFGLVAGYVVCLWLAEYASRKGIGNGASLLMLCSIAATLIPGFKKAAEAAGTRGLTISLIGLLVVVVLGSIIHLTVRPVLVGWAKLTTLRPAKPTNMSFRLLLGGIVPIILASSLLGAAAKLVARVSPNLSQTLVNSNGFAGAALLVILVSGLSLVYARTAYDAVDVTNELTKASRYVVGERPGWQTVRSLHRTTFGLAWWNAIVLVPVIFLPASVHSLTGVTLPSFIGSTTLILVAGLAEWTRQLKGLRTLDQRGDVLRSIERARRLLEQQPASR